MSADFFNLVGKIYLPKVSNRAHCPTPEALGQLRVKVGRLVSITLVNLHFKR